MDQSLRRRRRIGVLLALIIPPFGLFYSNILGGIVMLVVGSCITASAIMGFPFAVYRFIFFPVFCAIWAYLAAK